MRVLDGTISKSIILNLSDGITTPMSFLLPIVLLHGSFTSGRQLIIGTLGAATSMAFAFKSAESTEGTWLEWMVAFMCSALGGITPILCFMLLHEPFSSIAATLFVLFGIYIIAEVKANGSGFRVATYDTAKNIIPALVVVGSLSLL